ncbi:MAG: hypothetical protein L3J87_02100 [Thermoplasmata archaeon]|nr:hypothetical protein [Thermoplasmata archaeon]MCI4344403.1 hypothetical protein [Thermoplasmata archaeon]
MSGTSAAPSAPAAAPPAAPPKPKRTGMILAIVVVVLVVLAALGVYYYTRPKSSSAPPLQEGGFTAGGVVTFTYNGTNTWVCTPGLLTFFSQATAAAAVTPCEAGAASQNAVPDQLPEWVLVPAFAGLSIFGVTALGASTDGFPTFNSGTVLTQCGAGGTTSACVDHPKLIYSPLFTAVEQHINLTAGYGGYPEGVLPTPSHDHLLNTTDNVPNVPWGTIVVLVFDPNIFPDRATGACTATVASNLSAPTAHCLTSFAALAAALSTYSTSVTSANAKNPIWQTTQSGGLQVYVPGDVTIAQLNNLDSNLYIPFAVTPGAPSSFPT